MKFVKIKNGSPSTNGHKASFASYKIDQTDVKIQWRGNTTYYIWKGDKIVDLCKGLKSAKELAKTYV
jgi:hypothetical protein